MQLLLTIENLNCNDTILVGGLVPIFGDLRKKKDFQSQITGMECWKWLECKVNIILLPSPFYILLLRCGSFGSNSKWSKSSHQNSSRESHQDSYEQ